MTNPTPFDRNDLDTLMSRDPTDLASTDIDRIIAYHREARARRAAGEKTPKPAAAPTRDMSEIMSKLIKKPTSTLIRRV